MTLNFYRGTALFTELGVSSKAVQYQNYIEMKFVSTPCIVTILLDAESVPICIYLISVKLINPIKFYMAYDMDKN